MADWAVINSEDFRLDLFLSPELEWEEVSSEPETKGVSRTRAVEGKREDQLLRVLQEQFQDKARPHLLIVDEAGAGKSVLTLKIQQLLSAPDSSRQIFGDSRRRIVIHWSGKLPQPNLPNPDLHDLLTRTVEFELDDREPVKGERIEQLKNRMLAAIQYACEQNRLIVIIDGWDELSTKDRSRAEELINQNLNRVHWIIASRDYGVKDSNQLFQWPVFKRLRLKAFSESLQNLYMQSAKIASHWRTWLKGSEVGWNELLELPYHLREIVRYVEETKEVDPAWSNGLFPFPG